MKKLLSGMLLFLISLSCMASMLMDSTNVSEIQVKLSADLVSSYIWRGVKSSSSPNIQPTMALVYKNIEVGGWGSTDFYGKYKELDWYVLYTKGLWQFSLTDYNWNFIRSYFSYKHNETDHIVEAAISYLGGAKTFPLSINLNTMVYGADKKATNPLENAYSTYMEFKYPVLNSLNLFIGVTPWDGYYGDSYGRSGGFAVVNAGLTAMRLMSINKSFVVPFKITLGVNPQREDAYMVLDLTF